MPGPLRPLLAAGRGVVRLGAKALDRVERFIALVLKAVALLTAVVALLFVLDAALLGNARRRG